MQRLVPAILLTAVVSTACQDVQRPVVDLDVSDGSALGGFGNPHFFFLPPLVPPPHFSGTFDPTLLPVLRVEVTGPFATEAAATCDGPVFAVLDEANGLTVEPEEYAVDWRDHGLVENQVYRLCVHLQPSPLFDGLLGFRDVQPAHAGGPAESPVYRFPTGSPLPIRFRVEEGVLAAELCVNGTIGPDYDCTAAILPNNGTAVCEQATCALTTPANGLAEPTLFLIERVACPVDGNGHADWLAVDIPQYAGCMLVTVFDPAWAGFLNDELGIVATCVDLTSGPPLTRPDQDESLQLHLQRAVGAVEALPPRFSVIDDDCLDPTPNSAAAQNTSLPARAVGAAQAAWRGFRRALAGMLGPRTAYAFHSGFGGHTRLAPGPLDEPAPAPAAVRGPGSAAPALLQPPAPEQETAVEFRLGWALPSQMEKVTPLNTVFGNVGDVVPVQVKVTDNGRTASSDAGVPRPVRGATVHFDVVNPGGVVTPATAETDGEGIATVSWTLQPSGALELQARGFGIGVRPASGFGGFDALGNLPVPLETGVLRFDAVTCDANLPGLVRATIDGRLDALDDYANADVHTIPVNLGGRHASTGVVYIGNDCRHLYVAVVVGANADPDPGNSLRFVFDNVAGSGESADDDILSLTHIGGDWVFRDRYLSADCIGRKQADCGPDDPGAPDGTGAAAWNSASGTLVYEMRHPLASGDTQHDFQVTFGDAIGFYLALHGGRGSKGNTEWPDQKGRFKTYQQYVVRGPALP